MQEGPLTLLPDAVRYCRPLTPMPRCLRGLESIELGQKEAVAASSRAREARGQSGTPLGDPAIKTDSSFPGIQVAGLHEDIITLKAAKPSPLETLQELKEESETTRRNSLRKGEKSKEACVKKSTKEFQEKGVAHRATATRCLNEVQLGSPDGESGCKSRATGIPQTCSYTDKRRNSLPFPQKNGSFKQTAFAQV